MEITTKTERTKGGPVALSKLLGVFSACLLLASCGVASVTPKMWEAAEKGCKDQGGIQNVNGWISASDDIKEVRVSCRNGSELYLKF